MLKMEGLFSPEYKQYLVRRDNIKRLVLEAREKLAGMKLFGELVDTTNPEDLIATLYVLYKDYELYHERF